MIKILFISIISIIQFGNGLFTQEHKQIEESNYNVVREAYNPEVGRHITPTSDICSTYGYNVFKVYLDLMFTGERYPQESVLEELPNGTTVNRSLSLSGNDDNFFYVHNIENFDIHLPYNGGAYEIDKIKIRSMGETEYTSHRLELCTGSTTRGYIYYFYYRDNNNLTSALVPSVPHQSDGNVSNDYNEAFCYDDDNFLAVFGDFDKFGSLDGGYGDGYKDGYREGYNEGYNDAISSSASNPSIDSIFNGILEVALLPVNVFLTILNFEVFGINISGLVSGILTISIVIIIVRFILGGKSDDK